MSETQTEMKKCPRCGNTHIQRYGLVPTVKHGKRQRYLCSECGHSFY